MDEQANLWRHGSKRPFYRRRDREQGGTVDDARLTLALQVAALRFWLSRLAGPVAEQSEGQGSKDPAEFARIFRWRMRGTPDV